MPGDVIGCAIDVDAGEIEYFRNGESMGVAFTNVIQGPGHAYFPAVSLSYTERCMFNFGGHPFRYRGKGYAPLQQQPPEADGGKAEYLVNALGRILSVDIAVVPVIMVGSLPLPAFGISVSPLYQQYDSMRNRGISVSSAGIVPP